MTALVLAWLLSTSSGPDGTSMLDACRNAMKDLTSIEATVVSKGVGRFSKLGFRGTIKLVKPNIGQILLTDAEIPVPIKRVSDGKLMAYKLDQHQIALEQASPDGEILVGLTHCQEALYFFEPGELDALRSAGKGATIEGVAQVGGVNCDVLRITGTPKGITNRLYLGPGHIIYGIDNITERDGQRFGFESRLTDVRLNPKFRPSDFQLDVQFGRPVYTMTSAGPAMRELRRIPKGLRDGETMPNLRFTDLEGRECYVSDLVKSHRVTLVNFWSVFCAPCREELREFNAKLADWAKKGVGLVAVDGIDGLDPIQKYWKEQNLNFEPFRTDTSTANSIHMVGLPTTFVLDSDGKIVTSILGISMSEIQSAIDRTVSKH